MSARTMARCLKKSKPCRRENMMLIVYLIFVCKGTKKLAKNKEKHGRISFLFISESSTLATLLK
jgi:hypothetical protein